MLLFERILKILEIKEVSKRRLAINLDVPQPTFSRYFCEESQEKLMPYLWKIHEIFPDISRDWLFFGEGSMMKTPESELSTKNMQKRISELEKELKQEHQQNRKLTDQLLAHISNEPKKNKEQTA